MRGGAKRTKFEVVKPRWGTGQRTEGERAAQRRKLKASPRRRKEARDNQGGETVQTETAEGPKKAWARAKAGSSRRTPRRRKWRIAKCQRLSP